MTTLQIGDKAPSFKALDQNGVIRELSQFQGKKLVVFFYPKASTPGCTAEVCNLRDNYSVLQQKGYSLLGVSADTPEKQQKFIDKNNLPFDLLADTDHQVLNAFGVWGPKKFMGRTYDGIHRTTFVINEQGIISDIITKVKTKDHAAQILEQQ